MPRHEEVLVQGPLQGSPQRRILGMDGGKSALRGVLKSGDHLLFPALGKEKD
jgi:hypothetical protein